MMIAPVRRSIADLKKAMPAQWKEFAAYIADQRSRTADAIMDAPPELVERAVGEAKAWRTLEKDINEK